MTIYLGNELGPVPVRNTVDLTLEQVSHLKIEPFFLSFGRLMLTFMSPSPVSASEFARPGCPSLPKRLLGFGGDKECVVEDAKVDAMV